MYSLQKSNSDQVTARDKTRDQGDVDRSDPKNTFWENKITFHFAHFVVKLSK